MGLCDLNIAVELYLADFVINNTGDDRGSDGDADGDCAGYPQMFVSDE